MKYYLGIDLGGTNIAAGVVDENYSIVGKSNVKTKPGCAPEQIVADLISAARAAVSDSELLLSDISAIGVGCPGSTDPYNGIVVTATNISFADFPLTEHLKKAFPNTPIYIDNDANAAAYGEMIAGAGRGVENFVAVTLGTGVGAGIIINGKMVVGTNYAAGEIGHSTIDMNGISCSCGRRGYCEVYASVTALIGQTRSAMVKDKDSIMWKLCDGDLEKVNGRTSFDAMRAGDKTAAGVVDKYCEYVACGIVDVINFLQPDVLCIGGGISKEGDTLLDPVKEYAKRFRYSQNEKKQTEIKAAELGNDAGIIGAAFLFRLY